MDVQCTITEPSGLHMRHTGVVLGCLWSGKVVGMIENAAQCKEYSHGFPQRGTSDRMQGTQLVFFFM